ncbi:ChaN family lipoprotein [Myroides phaeus]|uniref:ChaN family lipoprotein n=1 Tax=Myroides phaeus TaxID=702745 RepID=UPI002DB90A58|nr:ChaN family lipoprotein [Myroides phaeus]MEC4116527.1 ChaN family lipoprotein [Myroides phaeus]
MKNIVVVLSLICSFGFAQTGRPYQIYNQKGKKVSYDKMIKELIKEDVVLFGEYHNNSLGHWLQLQTTESLDKQRQLVLGAEMFEADNQEGLRNYISGEINESEMGEQVRLWNNYETDYKPLVEYAKVNKLSFIATNVPRRFASMVYKKGVESLDTLSSQEKKWIAPLPFPYDSSLPGYQKMMTMFEDHTDENMPKAQAIKDATMAHFIVQNARKGELFLHFNGSYHSNNFEGIVWYLKKYNPALKIATITMVEGEDGVQFTPDNLGLANFIIVIDANILKSF